MSQRCVTKMYLMSSIFLIFPKIKENKQCAEIAVRQSYKKNKIRGEI